jgi:predicted enzyme related to lactoylglutathione lyase
MSGPARAGVFVFAKDPERVSQFYASLAGMSKLHETDEITVLESPDIQLLVHKIPDQTAKDIAISSPPERRENTALKFFFTVPSLDNARATASSLGGEVFSENWHGPGFVVCNATDPEGNIFQIRENVD